MAVKPLFSNFFSDYARGLVCGLNDFLCGVNNLRNKICDPLAVYTAKLWFYRRFSNYVSDYARILVFRHNDFSCVVNNLKNPICPPLAVFSAETAVQTPFFYFFF
jgi:hypothetical protein